MTKNKQTKKLLALRRANNSTITFANHFPITISNSSVERESNQFQKRISFRMHEWLKCSSPFLLIKDE